MDRSLPRVSLALWLSLAPGCTNTGDDLPPTDIPAEPPRAAPIAAYRFEADVVEDASGRGHTAACDGPCPMQVPEGRFGNAARFDGVGVLMVTDDGSLATPSGFTAAAWFYVDAIAARTAIFTKVFGSGANPSDEKKRSPIRTISSGSTFFAFRLSVSENACFSPAGATMS